MTGQEENAEAAGSGGARAFVAAGASSPAGSNSQHRGLRQGTLWWPLRFTLRRSMKVAQLHHGHSTLHAKNTTVHCERCCEPVSLSSCAESLSFWPFLSLLLTELQMHLLHIGVESEEMEEYNVENSSAMCIHSR